MAEMFQTIGKKDVEKFIIQHEYDKKGWLWPKDTIVLSTVTIHYRESNSDPQEPLTKKSPNVYMNRNHRHAEKHFLDGLRREIDSLNNVFKVEAELIQNYPLVILLQKANLYFPVVQTAFSTFERI